MLHNLTGASRGAKCQVLRDMDEVKKAETGPPLDHHDDTKAEALRSVQEIVEDRFFKGFMDQIK